MIRDALPEAWPHLLQECVRITRPGGSIRLTEAEYSLSNSPAFERIGALCTQALKIAGQSFSPDGRHIGITPMLGRSCAMPVIATSSILPLPSIIRRERRCMTSCTRTL